MNVLALGYDHFISCFFTGGVQRPIGGSFDSTIHSRIPSVQGSRLFGEEDRKVTEAKSANGSAGNNFYNFTHFVSISLYLSPKALEEESLFYMFCYIQ